MSSYLAAVRIWLLPVVLGVIALEVLLSAWGFAITYVWTNVFSWLWHSYQIRVCDSFAFASSVFDGVVGLLLGAALSYVIVRVTRGSFPHAWLLFALGFLLPLVIPSILSGLGEPASPGLWYF